MHKSSMGKAGQAFRHDVMSHRKHTAMLVSYAYHADMIYAKNE
jgi:hypothetical protein